MALTLNESVALIIPCLNEARTIRGVVSEARNYLDAIFVIDDGSSDGTDAEASKGGATVLKHDGPRGKGGALNFGFRAAMARGFAWALAMDGDGQHAPEDIPRFLTAVEEGKAQQVVGNRMDQAESMPIVRRAVNRWMSTRLSQFCGMHFPDSQCGFRMVHLSAWSSLNFSASHFEIESELLVRFAFVGFPITFVPIQTRYAGERSKVRPVRDTLRWFRWWSRIRSERLPDPLEPGQSAASANVACASSALR